MTIYAKCKCGQLLFFYTKCGRKNNYPMSDAMMRNKKSFSTNKRLFGIGSEVKCGKCGKKYDEYEMQTKTEYYENLETKQ